MLRPTSIQLASGKFFNFTRFDVEDIQITDIAHHLSMLCRFTGACREFYSVAQHSVIVSRTVPPEHALAGLLHDATEAYINDLNRPAKGLTPDYERFEKDVLWPVVARRFGLTLKLPESVKEADNIALVTERRDLMPEPVGADDGWGAYSHITPRTERIVPWAPFTAKLMFLQRYADLTSCLAPRTCGCASCNRARTFGTTSASLCDRAR